MTLGTRFVLADAGFRFVAAETGSAARFSHEEAAR
jgi:hypothetical protein